MKFMNVWVKAPFVAFLVVLASLTATTSAARADGTVRVLARADFFSAEMAAAFEKASGIKVEAHIFDARADRQLPARLMSGDSGYDLLIVPANFMTSLVSADRVQKLDRPVSGIHQVASDIQRALLRFSPKGDQQLRFFAVPLMWGSTGIGYGPGYMDALGPNSSGPSLGHIFDPANAEKLASCGIGLADSPNEVVGAALAYLGRDPRGRTDDDLAAAEGALMAIRPYVKKVYGDDLGDHLADGSICAALGWSGSILRASVKARDAGTPRVIGYAIPSEGSPLWIDLMAIPSNSENTDGAYALMEYLLKPDVGAEISGRLLYPSANTAANNLNWNNGLFADRRIYPKWEVVESMFMAPAQSAAQTRALIAMWERLKKADN